MILPNDAVANIARNVTDALGSVPDVILANATVPQCNTLGSCRTIWDIIWSCLVTIFACIWVAVHPNIPQPTAPVEWVSPGVAPLGAGWQPWARFQARWISSIIGNIWRCHFRAALTTLGEKLAVALLALLAPEFIFVWALRQWLRARSLAKECNAAASEVGAQTRARQLHEAVRQVTARAAFNSQASVPRSPRLQYIRRGLTEPATSENLADASRSNTPARRFDLVTMEEEADGLGPGTEINSPVASLAANDCEIAPAWSTTHGFFIIMGGFHVYDEDRPLVYLCPEDVIWLIRGGLLIPPAETEIQDRNKSDAFSKAIVLIQTLWFAMQCIARHIEHLPITELEITTAAYAIPILGMYICWWNKPLGVTQPVRIPDYVWGKADAAADVPCWDTFMQTFTGREDPQNFRRVPRFSAGAPRIQQIVNADWIASTITILFGAVHCLAWSFHFPSTVEQQLWRISCTIITALPVVWLITFAFGGPSAFFSAWASKWPGRLPIARKALGFSPLAIIPIYLTGRFMLLVLTITSLRSLPAEAYQTVYWTTLIPHV